MTTTAKIAIDDVANDAVIIDVRDDAQWAEGHATHALHIPIDQLEQRLEEIPKTDAPIPVTCGGGSKAGRAAALLAEKGFAVAEMTGGMRAWIAAGKDVVIETPQKVVADAPGQASMGTW